MIRRSRGANRRIKRCFVEIAQHAITTHGSVDHGHDFEYATVSTQSAMSSIVGDKAQETKLADCTNLILGWYLHSQQAETRGSCALFRVI